MPSKNWIDKLQNQKRTEERQRKALSQSEVRSRRVVIMLRPDERKALERAAKSAQLSLSFFVRGALAKVGAFDEA